MSDAQDTDAGLEALSLGHQAEIRKVEKALFGGGAPVLAGRFEVVRTVGRGAFGTVYEARDPELGRPVALKVLVTDDPASQRLLTREAQLMATVAHPNVATVYEVGSFDHGGESRVYIAMEFLGGQTLRAHLEASALRPSEVVDLYVQAGRGLAAAHARGVVHRDFKPDNALLGEDGRVRVVDFGLASATANLTHDGVDADDALDTIRHIPAGTPAYMAPEIFEGEQPDEASDQFSFCVALYEALFGRRPFAGETAAELASNVQRGALRRPPEGSGVPAKLREALERGLAVGRAQRHPSMEALLDTMTERSWWSRRTVIAISLVAVSSGVAGAAVSRGALTLAPPCAVEATDLAWTPARASELSGAFEAAAPPYGSGVWKRSAPRLDAFAERWATAATASCQRPRESDAEHRLRALEATCLLRAQSRFEELLAAFAAPSPELVAGAVAAIRRLPDPGACSDTEALRAATPDDDESRQQAEAIRSVLGTVAADIAGARYDQARGRLDVVAAHAQALGFDAVSAEVKTAQAELELKAGHPAASRARAREAFDAALRGTHEETAAVAAILLAQAGVADRHFVDDGLAWADTAESLLDKSALEHLRGAVAMARASLFITKRDPQAATEALTAAVAILEAEDPAHPRLAAAMGNWGALLLQRGLPDQAIERYEQALAATEQSVGPQHPDIATWLLGLGSAAMTAGDFERSERALRRALRLDAGTVGSGHPNAIQARMYLGVLAHNQTNFDDAIEHYTLALEAAERELGAQHPLVGEICLRFADTLSLAGKHEAAAPIVAQAQRVFEGMLPPDDPGLATVHTTALVAAARAGRLEQAVEHGRRGLELARPRGDASPVTVNLLHETARALIVLRRTAEALPLLQRAADALGTAVLDPRRRALVEFELAMAKVGSDRAAAIAHARTALRVQPDSVPAPEREQITRWLAEQGE